MRDFQKPGRSTVHALNGMAATSHPLATLAAVDMLRAGGTAADAAVAAAAVLAVVEPESTGIGGDGFALYAEAGGEPVGYNGSGRAPRAADASWYLERGMSAIPLTGPHSVTVPGVVDLWDTLLRRHGKKGLDAALQPAILAAEGGHIVSPRIAWDWAANLEKLRKGANAERYLLPGGRAPALGDVVRQPELGATLRAVARDGRDAFYLGPVAEDMVGTLRRLGGLHDLQDFAGHRTEAVTPIRTNYRGFDFWECPPNGPGVAALLMLNILEGFDLASLDPLGAKRFHLEAEATRHAYRLRETHVADPRFAAVDVERLLGPEMTASLRAEIDPDRAGDIPWIAPPMAPSTIYLSVVDRDRNVCSFINSLAYAFGSAVMSDKTGVLFQNRGSGFHVEPGHPNSIEGGKRPLHTLIPGMVTRNGRATLSFGVMGGQYQPVGQTHVATNIIDFGMDVQEAIDCPRGFHYEQVYSLEQGVPEATARELAEMGHKVGRSAMPHGGGQAIAIDWERGTLVGGSDPRKDGSALGY